METYTGKINEFVDWVTGVDSFTESNVTNNLPVSGSSIRQLLQNKLKTPFVSYEDKSAGLFRLFSSEDAKAQWINMTNPDHPLYDPEAAAGLELFNFIRPGDTAIDFVGLNSDPRYIIASDSSSEDSQSVISFWVKLQKEEAGVVKSEYDAFIVTYTITDAEGKVTTLSEAYGSDYCNHQSDESKKISINLYQYFTEGTNNVAVNIKAQNSSAQNNLEFSVSLVRFELSSSFDYSTAKRYGEEFSVPVQIRRSISNLNMQVKISILAGDGNSIPQVVSQWETSSTEQNITREFKINNTFSANETSEDHIKHLMRIEATMVSGNSTFRSNVLFYNFETAASTESVNGGIANKFINIAYNTPADKIEQDVNTGDVILQAKQYSPFVLNWAYYTDQTNEQSISVEWSLMKLVDNEWQFEPITTIIGTKDSRADALIFIPSEDISIEDGIYLAARYNSTVIDKFPIVVARSNFDIHETSGLAFKLDAYGKSNSSPNPNTWIDSIGGATTTFSFSTFDNANGWNNNSFVTSGQQNYAIVNYCPISVNPQISGKTIEFEFKSENVNSNDDVILTIGSDEAGHIDVTPNSATLYVNRQPVVQTNFKANEKIKLAFIFNPSTNSEVPESNLVYIVNNGILERAANADVYGYADINGRIKIGGSQSGIRVYNMRIYDRAISCEQELDNYIYDAEEKSTIISRNEIKKDDKIDFDLTSSKIDTILIEGNLDPILTKFNGKSECTANITRRCITDPTKNFTVQNARVRKHGQSTLNYPVVSLKIWLNKSNENGGTPILQLDTIQQSMNLNKNRYLMKNDSIPANKFVLQANYADSSGVHNGGIERLINDTWYNAIIDGEYKLRTAPQLFTTDQLIHHNDEQLNEVGNNAWVEGYGTGKAANKQWKELTGKDFPYKLRIAPDSFACAVFYRNTGSIGDDNVHFLGQYVFMDDKKSDTIYGERSIYSFGNNTDPFVMNVDNTKNGRNGKQDTSENRVWNNNNVMRVEVVLPNYELTSYMNFNVNASYSINEDGEVQEASGAMVPCTDIKLDNEGNPIGFYWEDFFDLIYPDPDDIEEDANVDKFAQNSKFRQKAQPFIDWLSWITSIGSLRKTNRQQAQQQFQNEASQHLDLYKLAAYYIFFLRFGLVDSVERNAQAVTFDGIHWFYAPWDMDIALGNINQGLLVLLPPMTRDSMIPGTQNYAFSGRTATTSNVLWDCLEDWDYWMNTIVPKVSQALYKAGLNYDNITKMFDEDYVEKWSETIYNDSGYFKYIENGGSEWLAWLQGARTSHRHWWLSTSMNYYDAKWSCGEFNEHRISLFADKGENPVGTDIVTIKPTSQTFFKFTQNDGTAVIDTKQCTRENPAQFDISTNIFTAKDPAHIYGSTFVEEIDVSCLAKSINSINLSQCYDNVLGAPIKVVNVGIPYTEQSSTVRNGYVSGTKFSLIGSSDNNDAFENLNTLNITGQSNINGGLSSIISNRKNVVNLYAMGTNITSFANSIYGNKFIDLELPSVTITKENNQTVSTNYMNTIEFRDASWRNLSFWSTVQHETNEATFTKTTVPSQLQTLKYTGSTASNACAGKLLLEWLDSIEAEVASANPQYTEQDVYNAISSKTFEAANINWGAEESIEDRVDISYRDLARIAKFNNGFNQNGTLSGYIRISDQQNLTTAQLSELRAWFGDTVFDLSAKNSRLVIDQNRQYVQISVGGVTTENGELYLQEPNAAILSSNKFMLGTDDTEYTWYLSTVENSFSAENAPQYARITKGDDGIVRLITDQSANGNYSVYIKTSYVENSVYYESNVVKINIIAVTYPTDWEWSISSNIREFKQTSSIASDIFGQSAQYDGQVIPAYIMYRDNMSTLFEVFPSQQGFTATVKSIEYRVSGINNNAQYPNVNQTDYIDEYLEVVPGQSGITIHTKSVPSTMTTYRLEGIIRIGSREIHKRINLIVMNDNTPILSTNQSDLFTIVSQKYATDYSLNGAYFDFYKSHLMSLYGTIDFSSRPNIQSLITNTNQTIFVYLTHINSVVLDGCSNIMLTDSNILGNDRRVFNFDNIIDLQNVTISNNNNISGTLDLSACDELQTVDISGTSLGIILPQYTSVSSLALGSPTEIQLRQPRNLDTTNTTIQSSSNLTSMILNTINTTSVCGFNMFNTLYNP